MMCYAGFTLLSKDDFIFRKNNKWWYKKVAYRSLRHLKTSSTYKLFDVLERKMADEIRQEIDSEIIKSILSLVGSNPTHSH